MITPTGTGMTQAEYSEAVLDGGAQHIRITFDNGVVLTDQDVEAGGMTLTDILNGETDLTFGRAVSKELNVSLLNSDRLNNVTWTREFTLEMGVDVVEGGVTVTKWVQVGIFRGSRPDKIHYVDVIAFTAHDRMMQFDREIDSYLNSLTWPVSFSDLLEGVCDFCNVEYIAGDELANIMSREFENTFSGKGLTGTSMLALMAEACGCYAKITPEGKMRMTWFSDATYAVDADHEFHVDAYDVGEGMTWAELGEYTWEEAEQWTWAEVGGYRSAFAVHGLSSKMSEGDIGVNYGDLTGNIYLIVDNPFLAILDDTDPENYIRPLYERLAEFGGYLPASIECVGNWLLEAGDVITVDIHGESIRMPIFCRTMTWNGGCNDRYEATGSLQRQAVSSENRQKLTDGGRFHEFRVDLDTLYSAIQDAEGNISTLQQTAEQIVLSLADKYDKVSGITITAAGIDVSGSQYVKIASGGTFEVESTNFSISSTDERMIAGNWQFDSEGVVFTNSDGTNTRFVISNDFDALDSNYNNTGIIYEYTEWETDVYYPTIYLFSKAASALADVYNVNFVFYTNGNIIFNAQSMAMYASSVYLTRLVEAGAIVPYSQGVFASHYIGDSNNLWDYGYFDNLYVKTMRVGGNWTGGNNILTLESSNVNSKITRNVAGQQRGILINASGNVLSYSTDAVEPSFGTSSYRWEYGYFTYLDTSYTVSASSKNVKHDIRLMNDIGDKLDRLRPVTFVYNRDEQNRKRYGLIWEEAVNVLPDICIGGDDGADESKAINYVDLIPMLLREIQGLRRRVKDLEVMIA